MGNPAVDAMLKILDPLRVEFTNIKETLDAASGKQAEAKAAILEEIRTETEVALAKRNAQEVQALMEQTFGDTPSASWAVFADEFATVIDFVKTMAEGYIDGKLSEKYKTVSGSNESLRAKAKEIREKFEALASSVKILDGSITIEDLPRLGSGGRPAGTGKHQVNKGKFTFLVNDVEQSATKLSTVLLSASAKCGGSGANGSYSVKEFMELLKATYPGISNEYAQDWSITLANNNVLSGKREMEVVE